MSWQELEIKDFSGLANSNRLPKKNEAQVLRNLDVRGVSGDLEVRAGYLEEHSAAPSNAKVSSVTDLAFENLYIPELNDNPALGKEIVCQIQKGTLAPTQFTEVTANDISAISQANPCVITFSSKHGIKDYSLVYIGDIEGMTQLNDQFYFVEATDLDKLTLYSDHNLATGIDSTGYDAFKSGGFVTANPTVLSINVILIWIRQYFNGTAWVDAWRWLNELFLTRCYSVDGTSKYIVFINYHDVTLVDYFNNWVVYNETKDQYATVIKSYNAGTVIGLKLAYNYGNWETGDTLLLMRNYIPYEYLTGMHSVTASDISFYKILNDLRICFGGQANRLTLALGYRKKYWRFSGFDFGSGDTDLTGATAKENFAKINEIILTPYIALFGEEAQLILTPYSSGTLSGDFSFRLVGVLDDFNSVLITEQKIVGLTSVESIIVDIELNYATMNKRITKLMLFASSDEVNYFLVGEVIELSQPSYSATEFYINSNGYLAYENQTDLTEIHTQSNAVVPSGVDADATTGWQSIPGGGVFADSTLASVSAKPAPPVGGGTYCYKVTHSEATARNVGAEYSTELQRNTEYYVTFKVYLSAAGTIGYTLDLSNITYKPIDAATWTEITLKAKTRMWYSLGISNKLRIFANFANTEYLGIDVVSIKKATKQISYDANTEKSIYMNDLLGYTPTKDMALSFDQAIVTQGRTFVVNPYIDKRYINKIFFSPISGAGAFQYDIITAENYYDLENFDGNDLVGVELLPNMDFIAFKRNSIQRLNSTTGQSRNIELGKGCVNRRTIINFGDKIIWLGENGAYLSDGVNVIDISDGTIRKEITAITDKTTMFAVREEKDNSYRLFNGQSSPNDLEYIFTKKGWITHRRALVPTYYALSKDGSVMFMSGGKIYRDGITAYLDAIAGTPRSMKISFAWKSVPFDINLLGDEIKTNHRIVLKDVWVNINVDNAVNFNLLVFYDTTANSTSITPDVTVTNKVETRRLPLGKSCKQFAIGISGTYEATEATGYVDSTQIVTLIEHGLTSADEGKGIYIFVKNTSTHVIVASALTTINEVIDTSTFSVNAALGSDYPGASQELYYVIYNTTKATAIKSIGVTYKLLPIGRWNNE